MKAELSTVENLESLTAIVPLDLQFRAKDIITKATLMAEQSQGALLKIVFAHNDRGAQSDIKLKQILSKYQNISLISEKCYEGPVNSALLRNLAFTQVFTKYVILLDVDLWLDIGLLKKYLPFVHTKKFPFIVLPCLYLSRYGSKSLMSHKHTPEQLRDRYFAFERKEFLHLANPSSIVMMRSVDYRSLNGFDIEFCGHGYEDFDFMIRLACLHSLITSSSNFFFNSTTRSPLFVQGFRRELGKLCLDALLERDFFIHIFHEKTPQSAQYYSLRKDNFSRFRELYKDHANGNSEGDPTLITAFMAKCLAQEKNVQDYSIYFENKPGHIDRFDTFRRRMKFLFK